MIIEIVRFDGDWVALLKVQSELTGNYAIHVRKVRGEYGNEFINFERGRVGVSRLIEEARENEKNLERLYQLKAGDRK